MTITPHDILSFWRDAGEDRWWKKNDAFDAEIREKFLGLWHDACAGRLAHWQNSDDGALALVIVLDQFPRNMFRNDARTYASDALAREVAHGAVAAGADGRVDQGLRSFLYMPFMHSEQLTDQERCIALFESIGQPDSAKWARHHADIIRKYGRFPHRNGILGRATTPDEQAFLDAGGFTG